MNFFRRFFFVTIFFVCAFFASAFSENDIENFCLENGLQVFVLSDFSCATIRAELCVDAGFSRQTEETSGFFPLYAKLLGAKCFSDCARIEKICAPQDFKKILLELKNCLEPFSASDEKIAKEFSSAKNAVIDYEKTSAAFVNAAIDSRIFSSDEIWIRESGIYPSLFLKTSEKKVRAVLQEISNTFYTADNAILFISGCVENSRAQSEVEKIFSNCRKSVNPEKKNSKNLHPNKKSNQKKFVISSPEFSEELTQVVLQYVSLSADCADCVAQIFSPDESDFKKKILREMPKQKILSAQYLNVASERTKNFSRLIIQTILQTNDFDAFSTSQKFLELVKKSAQENFCLSNVQNAKNEIQKNFKMLSFQSAKLMELFASWIFSFGKISLKDFFSTCASFPNFDDAQISSIKKNLADEEPYIFILVNSIVYEKNKEKFLNAGFQIANEKNVYAQNLLDAISKFRSDEKIQKNIDAKNFFSEKEFLEKNKNQFSQVTLLNSIPVNIKRDENSGVCAVSLIFFVGKTFFANDDSALCDVLIECLSQNIFSELKLREKTGILRGTFSITQQVSLFHSAITIVCQSEDFFAAIESASRALLFSEISPQLADRAIFNAQQKNRFDFASSENRFFLHAKKTLSTFDENFLQKLFTPKNEILLNIDFFKIVESYRFFLHSDFLTLSVLGGVPSDFEILEIFNRTFGTLSNYEDEKKILPQKSWKKLDKKLHTQKVFVERRFFSDLDFSNYDEKNIPILTPTKIFFDPALFVFDCDFEESAIFSAVLFEIASRLEQNLAGENFVKVFPPKNDFPFGAIFVSRVEKISLLEKIFENTILDFLKEAEKSLQKNESDFSQKLKNLWIVKNLSEISNAEICAQKILEGILKGDAKKYLLDYEKILSMNDSEILECTKKYFLNSAPLKIYSKDQK